MSAEDYRTDPDDLAPLCPACRDPLVDLEHPEPTGDRWCEPCKRVCTGSASEFQHYQAAIRAKAAEESEAHERLRDGVEAARLNLDGQQ